MGGLSLQSVSLVGASLASACLSSRPLSLLSRPLLSGSLAVVALILVSRRGISGPVRVFLLLLQWSLLPWFAYSVPSMNKLPHNLADKSYLNIVYFEIIWPRGAIANESKMSTEAYAAD